MDAAAKCRCLRAAPTIPSSEAPWARGHCPQLNPAISSTFEVKHSLYRGIISPKAPEERPGFPPAASEVPKHLSPLKHCYLEHGYLIKLSGCPRNGSYGYLVRCGQLCGGMAAAGPGHDSSEQEPACPAPEPSGALPQDAAGPCWAVPGGAAVALKEPLCSGGREGLAEEGAPPLTPLVMEYQ